MTETAPTAPVVVARGLRFPEGPALSPSGDMLYVVNLETRWLSRLEPATGTLTLEWAALPDGGRGNGMTLGPDGDLYVADVGRRLIARVSLGDGEVSTIADRTDTGAVLRGPNDLVFDRRGGIYFTDPQGSWDAPVGAVYYVAPITRIVSRVADGLQFPNGLVLSPDETALLVAETPLHRITRVSLPSGEKRAFATVSTTGGPDGMRWGPDGHLYAAIYGEGVIARISAGGGVLARLPVGAGEHPTNLCFAPDGRAMYVTEADSGTIIKMLLG
jgi:gluconolactonase